MEVIPLPKSQQKITTAKDSRSQRIKTKNDAEKHIHHKSKNFIAFFKAWRFDFQTFTPILTTRPNHVHENTAMCKIVSKAILRLLFLALNNFRLLFVTKLQGRVGEKWLISGGKGENEISGESRKKRRLFLFTLIQMVQIHKKTCMYNVKGK